MCQRPVDNKETNAWDDEGRFGFQRGKLNIWLLMMGNYLRV